MELKLFYNGSNNGDFYLSIRAAADLIGTSSNTARKSLNELVAKGFIIPHVKGSYHWKVRHATTWILAEHSFEGKLPTHDYLKWRPEIQKPVSNFEDAVSNNDTDPQSAVVNQGL